MKNEDRKFPKTFHFTWSPNLQNDDRMLPSDDILVGKNVVASLKIDGENCCMSREHIHARSISSKDHPSRHWVKSLHAQIKFNIPENWFLFGENVFATHSIHYRNLPSYFFLFTVVNEQNIVLSWDETKEWAELLGLQTVPPLYEGVWDVERIKACQYDHCPMGWGDSQEGYVVRNSGSFHWDEFQSNCGKCVRKDHVQTSDHWLNQALVPNELSSYATKLNGVF